MRKSRIHKNKSKESIESDFFTKHWKKLVEIETTGVLIQNAGGAIFQHSQCCQTKINFTLYINIKNAAPMYYLLIVHTLCK